MQYVIERKIRLNLRLIQGIFRLTHTLGIKGPVPGLHREAALLIINDFLDIGLFLHRTGARRRDNSTHKGQCGLRRFCHLVGDAPARKVVKAQKLRLARTQCRETKDQLAGIIFIAFLRTQPACVEQVFTGLSIAKQ